MKLYWSEYPDGERWCGPYATDDECKAAARDWGMGVDGDVQEIWVAPVDEEADDDDAFWDAVAQRALWLLEDCGDGLIDDGWLDPEEAWPGLRTDRKRILANALRQVLGPRPEWRTVDTQKARRVEL